MDKRNFICYTIFIVSFLDLNIAFKISEVNDIMKKLLNFILGLAFTGALVFLLFNAAALAQEMTPSVYINGEQLIFDVQPIIEDDRTLVPLRAISEHLLYDVEWDNYTETAIIKNANSVMKITIGKTSYESNGEIKELDVPAKLVDDRTLVPLRVIAENFGCTVDWDQETYSVLITKTENSNIKTVEVKTAQELLENITSDTKLILTEKLYNLSDVTSVKNSNVHRALVHDGFEFIISNVSNLEICPKNETGAEIVVVPRYANVLTFSSCNDIKLTNITAGHTVEQGNCTGGVINLENSPNVSIDNCKLYGCGTYGVTALSSDNLKVSNTEIYECTYGGVTIDQCINTIISDCTFRDIEGYDVFNFMTCKDIKVSNSVIKNNTIYEYGSIIASSGVENAEFINCEFSNNVSKNLYLGDTVVFTDCDIK